MSEWSKIDRLNAVFKGEKADRPPVSSYTHEVAAERNGDDLVAATLRNARAWDWDWIKLNPRTVHYAEAWGNEYDYDDYPVPFLPIPAQKKALVNTPDDLWKVNELDIAGNAPIEEQLDVIRKVKEGAPDTPVFATLYSPINVLSKIAGLPLAPGLPAPGSTTTLTIHDLFRENRAGVHHALHAIAETLAKYAEAQKEAGADGLVFVVASITNPGFLSEAEYNEFSRPYDDIELEGADGLLRIVHTCGAESHPQWFQEFPLEGINWDHEDPTNPDIGVALNKTKVGGVNHNLLAQEPTAEVLDKIREEVTEARKVTGDVLVVAPTCSVSSKASHEAIAAYKEAATA